MRNCCFQNTLPKAQSTQIRRLNLKETLNCSMLEMQMCVYFDSIELEEEEKKCVLLFIFGAETCLLHDCRSESTDVGHGQRE